ncbi:biotin/lipoyl-containing protein, partial [Burkholderia cepacia]
ATVAAGAVVGLVEVMKQFTEIETDAAGRVVELLVEDGEPVDAGQVLMRIEG